MYDAKKDPKDNLNTINKFNSIIDRGFYNGTSYNLVYNKTCYIPKENIITEINNGLEWYWF